MQIAGKNTAEQWRKLSESLNPAAYDNFWKEAFEKFYLERVNTRYLKPIEAIVASKTQNGEGFAVVALFCTLIEFFGTTEAGVNFNNHQPKARRHEYGKDDAKGYFKSILKHDLFKPLQQDDFYGNVRCALLHEARTAGKWAVGAKGVNGKLVIRKRGLLILNRSRLVRNVREYTEDYHKRLKLPEEIELRKALERKFTFLAKE